MRPSLLRLDHEQCARYSQGAGIYRILPAAVGRPCDLGELRWLIARAGQEGWTITPRGAGTAMDGSNLGPGLVIDLAAFEPGRCEIDPVARTARVTPGMTLREFNDRAGLHGLRLPPDPSSSAWATLGGVLSTNASGARSFRHGSVRAWILGATLETADGPLTLQRGVPPDPHHSVVQRWNHDMQPRIVAARDIIAERFPRVTKNSAGYALDRYAASGDLLDLVIGAEGTLGLVTDMTWRLGPVPRHRATIRVLVRRRDDLVQAMDALRLADPVTLEFLDRTFLGIVDAGLAGADRDLVAEVGGMLFADLEGDDPARLAAAAAAALKAAGPWTLRASVAMEPADIAQLWRIRHGASPALAALQDGRKSLQVIEDGAVPPGRLPDCLDAIQRACGDERIGVVLFGHAGDGHVHANLLPDLSDTDWEERVERIYHAVTDAVLHLGGTPSGEHGTGRLRSGVLERTYGADIVALFRGVKAVFDPAGRWNDGVLIPSGRGPLEALKVGRHALSLGDDAERFLLAIEQQAGWGTDRWLPR